MTTLADYTYDLAGHADNLDAAQERGEWGAAMQELRKCMEDLQEIAPLLVERGVRAGMTQRRMADLMGIPERTLTGAKREFAR